MLMTILAFFFFNDTATTEIYTLSLHDALPIFSSLALPFPLAQRLHHTLPDPRQPPAAKVAIDRMSIADIRGHHAPLASRLVDIENAIDDTAEVHGLSPWSPRAPLGWRQQELENLPLCVAHICGIVTCGAHSRPSYL